MKKQSLPPIILSLILLTIEPVHGRLLRPQGVRMAAPADVRNAPEFIPCGCVEASIWGRDIPGMRHVTYNKAHNAHGGKS